jgi:uncharacterized phage protein (TIGR02218 family)
MAEYEDNLEAIEQSATPEFYVFTSGSTVERYTTFSRELTFLGQVFSPASIKRGKINYNTNFAEVTLDITTPITPNMAKYIPSYPIEPVSVVVYRSHIDYLDQYEVFFTGQIKGVQFSGLQANARCVSSNKYLKMKIPNIIYQAFCNNDLFDERCQVSSYDFRGTYTITNILESGRKLEISYVSGYYNAVNSLRGGKVQLGTDIRFITWHNPIHQITLHAPLGPSLAVGSSVYVWPGCDGSASTCLNKFDNLDNFLGMAYIPSRNPVIWGFK